MIKLSEMESIQSLNAAISVFTRTYSYLRRSRKWGADLECLKVEWARETLNSMGVRLKIIGDPVQNGPIILVGNHISYLDIPLLMQASPGVSFLAKSEIARWPIIGEGARAMGTTFVVRGDRKQRAGARLEVAIAMERRKKLVLFPSGTTCISESKPWRKGAFEVAKAMDVPIQPFRISYSPLRAAAYIDRDFFPYHLFQLARKGGIDAVIEFGAPVIVDEPLEACASIWAWTRRNPLCSLVSDR